MVGFLKRVLSLKLEFGEWDDMLFREICLECLKVAEVMIFVVILVFYVDVCLF